MRILAFLTVSILIFVVLLEELTFKNLSNLKNQLLGRGERIVEISDGKVRTTLEKFLDAHASDLTYIFSNAKENYESTRKEFPFVAHLHLSDSELKEFLPDRFQIQILNPQFAFEKELSLYFHDSNVSSKDIRMFQGGELKSTLDEIDWGLTSWLSVKRVVTAFVLFFVVGFLIHSSILQRLQEIEVLKILGASFVFIYRKNFIESFLILINALLLSFVTLWLCFAQFSRVLNGDESIRLDLHFFSPAEMSILLISFLSFGLFCTLFSIGLTTLRRRA